ncbi:hypothetical protein B0H14DRAFT_2794749 [Mycena olivaceomarginata]|nr:hypothetical protein B0H14DRAFT_2794749 [Mycena olivaceomarginata]
MPVISSLKPSNPPQPAQVAQPAVAATPAAGIQFLLRRMYHADPWHLCARSLSHLPRLRCLRELCACGALWWNAHGRTPDGGLSHEWHWDSTVQPVRSRAVVTYTMPGAANAAYAAPPAYTSPGTSQGGTFAGQSVPGGVDDNISGATTGGTTAGGTTSAATGPTDGWGPFFDTDLNPSPAYTALMSTIFGHLDSARTGFLPPEAYSRFADDMGYPTHENIWKNAGGAGNPSTADAVFKRVLDFCGIEHITQARTAPENLQLIQALAGMANLPMPLLTSRGLADLMALELLSDPPAAWPKFARAVQLYGLYNIEPVVPAVADPRVLAKLAGLNAQVLGAANVGAQIQAAANLAAVNAIGGNAVSRVFDEI